MVFILFHCPAGLSTRILCRYGYKMSLLPTKERSYAITSYDFEYIYAKVPAE